MNIADVAQHVHALENKIKGQADEIERLREALKKIANGYSDEDGMKNIARAALKGDE